MTWEKRERSTQIMVVLFLLLRLGNSFSWDNIFLSVCVHDCECINHVFVSKGQVHDKKKYYITVQPDSCNNNRNNNNKWTSYNNTGACLKLVSKEIIFLGGFPFLDFFRRSTTPSCSIKKYGHTHMEKIYYDDGFGVRNNKCIMTWFHSRVHK